MNGTRLLLPLLAAVLLTGAACAKADSGTPGDTGSTGSYAADAAVVQVSYVGGFVSPDMLVTRLPLISVYGDGRVVTEGPVIAIYPGPALPNVQVQQISVADVDKLVKLGVDAGVGASTDYGQPGVTDAPDTKFAVLTTSGLKTSQVYALGEANGSGLTDAQVQARAKLKAYLAQLTDLPKTLGQDAVSASKPYEAKGLAAVSRTWNADSSGVGQQPEIAWPGPALPGEPVRTGFELGCVTVTGDQLTATLDAAKKANTATPWTSGGKRWSVTFRPLLPDEASCADLKD
ncbi:hypothetical protein HDA40_002241 [Hamadaea flava]|uniref:Uncharacterized protein n=1 Tax=Hamadaea flava TaxID=1742688 RepID=A0ABV8LK04_9ACTN|nr:hypothetical protein [Hamadaea flava]MCP2323734.1 hypothetical protein [Hamadaea flava]